MFHDFIIGTKKSLKNQDENLLGEWWKYLLTNNVIVAGFDDTLEDRGTHILRDTIRGGDWILAYSPKHGYVGVGLAKSRTTYKLREDLSPDCLSTNSHYRGIRWLYYFESLDDAIPAEETGFFHPLQTQQTIDNEKAVKIIKMLLQHPKAVIRP